MSQREESGSEMQPGSFRADGGETDERSVDDTDRFEAVCEGCSLNTIVEWDGEKGLCDRCRAGGDST